MQIAFTSISEQNPLGGAEISTKLLQEELGKKRLKVIMISIARKNKSHSNKSMTLPLRWIPTKVLYMGTTFSDLLISYYFKKFLQKNKVNLVHIHDIYILPGIINALKNTNIPCVATVRDNVPRIPVFSDNLVYKAIATLIYVYRAGIIKKALLKTDKIIAISNHIKSNLVNLGIPQDKIEVIYNIAPDWKCIKKRESIIFSAGRLKEEKGFDILIRAFNEIKDVYPNTNLIIAGDGPYYEKLRRLIINLNLKDRVYLVGKKNYNEMQKLYCKSIVVVMPSLYPEPLGRILVEAISVGKPTIASQMGGMTELVKSGFNGLTYTPIDYKALAKCLKRILDDLKIRKSFSQNAQKIMKKILCKEKIVSQTLLIYSNLLKGELTD